jgi:hypothetical protein
LQPGNIHQPITKSDVEYYGHHQLENYQRAAICGKQPFHILMEQEPLERERKSFVQGLIRKPAYRLKLIMYLNMSKLFFCNVSAAAGVHKKDVDVRSAPRLHTPHSAAVGGLGIGTAKP